MGGSVHLCTADLPAGGRGRGDVVPTVVCTPVFRIKKLSQGGSSEAQDLFRVLKAGPCKKGTSLQPVLAGDA